MPFIIRMQGDSQKALGFVTALLTYPYLSVQRSRIVVNNTEGDAEIEIEVQFNFRIETQSDSEAHPLQASAPQADQGVRIR